MIPPRPVPKHTPGDAGGYQNAAAASEQAPRDPLRPTEAEIEATEAIWQSCEHMCPCDCAEDSLRAAYALALPRLISAVVAAMPAVDEDDIVGLAGQWINRHDLELLLLAAAARLVKEER